MKIMPCSTCKKEVKVFVTREPILCGKCVNQLNFKQRLSRLDGKAPPSKMKDEYNKYLFRLYLQFIRRYHFNLYIIKQAESLLEYLSIKIIIPLTTWEDVHSESRIYRNQYPGKKGVTGCPFIKIGKMLNELGVLPAKSEDYSQFYIRVLNKFPLEKLNIIKRFILFEKNKNISDKTIILRLDFIFYFQVWANFDIYLLSALDIQTYFVFLQDKGHTQSYISQSLISLSDFFNWSKSEKIIFANPCIGIKIKRPVGQLTVCDDNTVSRLMNFVKNPKSDPEQAFLLALILIWGFKSEDLSFSKIEIKDNTLKIILRRKKLRAIKYYNRNQVLEFPNEPKWFYSLQKRFYAKWLAQYNQLKKDYPNYYLMLPRYRSVQPLTKATIQARVFEATFAATGERIPPKVLRKSCGNLHSSSSDASLLSALGWSSEYCFRYTWLPRKYFKNSKNN
jgi:site-specific recombinase XerD